MSEWNGILDSMDYDELQYDDHELEIYLACNDYNPERRDEL